MRNMPCNNIRKDWVMKAIDRNPDIDLDNQAIPDGCYLHEGQFLQNTARAAKIPFGIGYRGNIHNRKTTFGLIIREEHEALMLRALEQKKLNAIQNTKKPKL